MGCGASTDGYSNHGASPYPRSPMAQQLLQAKENLDINDGGQVDRETLETYLQVERDIAEAEQNNPLQPLELKSEQLTRLNDSIQEMEDKLKQLEEKTQSEDTADAVETHKFFLENGVTDELTDEQEAFLDAANKKEIASQELQTTIQQRDKVQSEVAELEVRANHLQELYKKHDEILDRLFGGEYGSSTENRLEAELDELEAHRGRILEANFKWRQAQMMLEFACKQLAVAVQKWQDLPTIPTIDLEIRYVLATETRNNLVAAGQNITGAQRYLDNVNFPYCSPQEIETLNKATAYLFTDMQSPDRHAHAAGCYNTTHQRANALLQWFDTVINTTIMKDLADINERAKEKTLELRRERVRLIQERVRTLWGTEIDIDSMALRGHDLDFEAYAQALATNNSAIKVNGHDDADGSRADTPAKLGDDELAPMPSNTVIFGNSYDHYQNQLNTIHKQHQDEMETFMKEQELNQQRITQSLQEKLNTRRQRRARVKIENMEKSALKQQITTQEKSQDSVGL